MTAERIALNKEISALRRVIAALESLEQACPDLGVEENLDEYREWLQESIASREAL